MEDSKSYAYLPEDLLLQMLEKAPNTAQQLAENIEVNDEQVADARKMLERQNLIRLCSEGEFATSIMAADGASIIEHKIGADILLAIAVGVDGLSDSDSTKWPQNSRQYQQWQYALPHHVANPRLAQGIMFLMELSILAEADREVRIMDGSHITTILKLNSLLSANDGDAADQPYVNALTGFLKENYEKVIPDIPVIIRNAFTDDSIVSIAKYSSSREIIDSQLGSLKSKVKADDKVFMTSVLQADEYTEPMPVGQCRKDKYMWKQAHIVCNLSLGEICDTDDLNEMLEEAIKHFRVEDGHDSELYFCYYKPHDYTPAYRIEMKRHLVEQSMKVERVLRSIKNQIISPEIREPYPQYLADVIAKNISFGMGAVDQAICNDRVLSGMENLFNLLSYRTK